MNGLFSDVTFKDVLIYIGFGGFLGIIYSATASLIRAMTEVFSRDFICRVLSETPGAIVAISNTPNKIKMPLVIKDIFRAFFIQEITQTHVLNSENLRYVFASF